MSKKYLSVLEITQSGRLFLHDILSAFETGRLHAYSDMGPVKFISCPNASEWSDSENFNIFGQWVPDDKEKAEHEESLKWEAFLSKMWACPVRLSKRIVPPIGELPDNPDFFPMPLDEQSALNMGLERNKYTEILRSLLIPLEEIEGLEDSPSPLSGREEATYLKIMKGLMLALKIQPDSRNATAQVKATLEIQGIEIDDETIRKRIFKIRNKKT